MGRQLAKSRVGTGSTLHIGTRKGAFLLHDEGKGWHLSPPMFLGAIINHLQFDPRDPARILVAGRWPRGDFFLHRSADGGATWQEAVTLPKIVPPPPPSLSRGAIPIATSAHSSGEPEKLRYIFSLAPGPEDQPGSWFAGGSPPSLFFSRDHGENWEEVHGFNRDPRRPLWIGGPQESTPDGAFLHSLTLDPRCSSHFYIGVSTGGVFETLDGGGHFQPLNQGCEAEFIPFDNPEYGHDPHTLRCAPANPDILYQQNHCGVYRLARPGTLWERIGKNLPADIGDIGFPLVVHPTDAEKIWVIPMDGTTVWPRVSIQGRPAVFHSADGGKTWRRQDAGLPKSHAYFTIKRQAMTIGNSPPFPLFFGTTGGEIYRSTDEGESWHSLCRHLPEILALEARTRGME